MTSHPLIAEAPKRRSAEAPKRRSAEAPKRRSASCVRDPRLFLLVALIVGALCALSDRPAWAQDPEPQSVPAGWQYIPGGIGEGQSFRLLFVSQIQHKGEFTTISNYNRHIQWSAGRNATLKPFQNEFRALASTATVDARDNTATTGAGVPIYWVGGEKVADDYADFYDGNWDSRAGKEETGASFTANHGIFTGSNADGTKSTTHPLGNNPARVGSLDGEGREISYSNSNYQSGSHRLYGLSPVITVAITGAPAKADLLQAIPSTTGSGTVLLTWNLPWDASITKYQVAYRPASKTGTTWRDIPDSGVRPPGDSFRDYKTSYLVTELENGTEYLFWVRAVNATGVGVTSVTKRATPKWPDDEVVVHGKRFIKFKATPGNDRIEVRWSHVGRWSHDQAHHWCGYRIWWRKSGDADWNRYELRTSSHNPRTTITGLNVYPEAPLTPGTSYQVRVYVNSCTRGEAAELAWTTTVTTTGTAPSNAPAVLAPAPALEWARVRGAELALRFDAGLDESSVPAASAFAVRVAGSARGVSAVTVSQDLVILTLAQAVTAGDVVTVGYAPPSSGRLRSPGGAEVAAFSGQSVANDTPAAQQAQRNAPGAASPPDEPDPPEETADDEPAPDAPIERTGTNGPDDLVGEGGDDRLIGKRGADVLRGKGGHDELRGGAGHDELLGGGGDDDLLGGKGDDELRGGRGADRLSGGDGDDTYTGGPGADRFIFVSGETGDKIITDFGDGNDLIVLKTEGGSWPAVADIIAGVEAQGTNYYVYTLSDGLTVETDVALRAKDFVVE